MKNTEKLYIAKEAGLRGLFSKGLGSRGSKAMIVDSKNAVPGGFSAYENMLYGAKGLKGLTRPNLKQLKETPKLDSPGYSSTSSMLSKMDQGVSYGRTNTLKNPMVSTPLAKLLQALGLGTGGAGVGYAGYKGLEADDNLGEPYNYKGNPNR